MTLNGVISLILLFFTEFDNFAGQLRHSGGMKEIYMYNVHRILYPRYSLQLLAKDNPPCSAVSLQ